MLLVYVPKITPRNRYVFKTIFKNYLAVEYTLTSDAAIFAEHKRAKFSYLTRPLGEELHFTADGLLEQSGISEKALQSKLIQDTPTIFPVRNETLEFDVFAATFYMLSRYEEYLPHMRDQYDRFTAKDSLAAKAGFLKLAVVDRWVLLLKKVLQEKFPESAFPKRKFKYLPTIDIDNAYAYKHKGLLRTIGSIGKSLLKLDFSRFATQLKVIFGKKSDPFDTYDYQLALQKKYSLKAIYFILIGDYGLNDKNLPYQNRYFKSLIKSLSDYADIGIHPSFGSNKDRSKLLTEINRLKDIIKTDVKRSRQHFLKLSLPETYRNLLETDIEEDYTMGFASELGFRAGTCTPYPFYDLDGEVECKLTVFPFQVMEATLKYYLNLEPDVAITESKKIIDEIKLVEGTFVSLWHNESLSEEEEWEGWRKVYEEVIEYAVSKENFNA
ncbi:polysaccharide deacetylase family protein [Vicingaceae bacterium]|nr:polysaccharide deacetylase family protein [Vicingaceae bacterium]MDC1451793.1 polysaccharide deacetylase family protein [Vicingaceae bacterium]